MPARFGDTRTSAQKEEDAKKRVYNLLTEEFQSWGALKRAAKRQGLSTATLAKHLKKFVGTGVALRNEEVVEGRRLPRTFYRITSLKPWLGDTSERDFYVAAMKTPSLSFSEEEMHAWVRMETAVKIFSYQLAAFLSLACKADNLKKAREYMESMLDVRLKDRIKDLTKIFYKYRSVGDNSVPISTFVKESLMIQAEESTQSWLFEDLNKEFEKHFRTLEIYLPDSKSTMGWIILSSESKEEALGRIKEEIEDVESSFYNPHSKRARN